MGFPYAFIICFMCFALYFLLLHEMKEINLLTDRRFQIPLLDPLTRFELNIIVKLLFNLVAAPWTIARAAAAILAVRFWPLLLLLASTYGVAVALALASLAAPDVMALAIISFFCFAVSAATIRCGVRGVRGIAGNVICDAFAAFCLFPALAMQLEKEAMEEDDKDEDDDNDGEGQKVGLT